MRDHVGGGFHRYSVDADWRVPHFEKMLYDQAQLVLAYLEAAQITESGRPRGGRGHDPGYVLRDMRDAEGGFCSAEDADSLPPDEASQPGARKSEGAFYIWGCDEVDALLGEDAGLVRARFGMEPEGNAPFDPQGEFGVKNLLYIARSVPALAQAFGGEPEDIARRLSRAREGLFAARARRPRPHLDDKILSAWNGMMIAALARASRLCWSAEYWRRRARQRHS